MLSPRSTLKLDLKNLTTRRSAPHIGRIGLVIVSVITIVSTVASINSPSASTAMVVHYDRVKTEDIISSIASSPQADPIQPISTILNGADDTSALVGTKGLIATTGQQTPPILRRPQIRLATLAPSLSIRTTSATPKPPQNTVATSAVIKAAIIQPKADDFDILLTTKGSSAYPPESVAVTGHELEPANEDSPQALTRLASISTLAPAIYLPDDTTPSTLQSEKLAKFEAITLKLAKDALANDHYAGSSRSPATIPMLLPDAGESPSDPELSPVAVNLASVNPQSNRDQKGTRKTQDRVWHEEEVRKRDTLSQIFYRFGLRSTEAYALAKLKGASALNTIRPGQKISITKTVSADDPEQQQLEKLRFPLNRFDTLLVTRQNDGYKVSKESREPVIEYQTATAEVSSSLLAAAKKSDIPAEFVYDLASIFGWQVDFAKNIQPGDRFSIIYEQKLLDDKVVGYGQIVAAELITDGKKLVAVRHVDENNRVAYFSPDGEGMQGSFLRSPIKYARITSKFTNKRLHPIHKTWKAHKGVDYGAPMNTPIRATGDGVVKLAGKNKGYGNVVVLQHGKKYETLYAHMNKFKKGLKPGTQIKQGDIIGYVGKTGWATGPHLHYEFRTNGQQKNPLTVELPKSLPIGDQYRKQFVADASKWVNQLERNQRIALAKNSQ